jgi:uncharacterized damage-inducible protein DinB
MKKTFSDILINGLRGASSNVHPLNALEGLSAKMASQRPDKENHSVWEILHHMVFWQDLILNTLRGKKVEWPKRSEEGWLGSPGSGKKKEWDQLVNSFHKGLRSAERIARNNSSRDLTKSNPEWNGASIGSALQIIVNHNGYHLGQIIYVRKLLKRWPPPKGGDTW